MQYSNTVQNVMGNWRREQLILIFEVLDELNLEE